MKKNRVLLLKPLDWLFNRKIKRYILGVNAIYIVGSKGAGKSTLYALAAEVSKKISQPVYSQYPYEGTYKIPVVEEDQGKLLKSYKNLSNGKVLKSEKWLPHIVYSVDKDWLYTTDFSNSTILLDEARTIYPNRDYKNWSVSDDEFFNFLRKRHVSLFLSSQAHDCVDLNVRRAVDEVWFLWKKTRHSPFTHIEVYESMIVPIENLDKSVKLSWLSKEMHPLDWDICFSMTKKFIFYRPPYYGLFDTDFYYGNQEPSDADEWDMTEFS